MADDFTGVPSEEWWHVRQTVRDLNFFSLLIFVALIWLVLILIHKGIISVTDLVTPP